MTLHCLLVDPPRPGLALPDLVGGPLEADAAAALYAASIRDAVVAADRSGGELLVNYPPPDALPAAQRTDATPEAELRGLVADAGVEPESVRFEVQVGSNPTDRAEHAVEHLLAEAGEATVAVLRGTAPTLDRTALDGAAMRLRRNPVVLAPGSGGRAPYLGLAEPMALAAAPPEVESLAEAGREAGHEVAFLAHHPVLEDEAGLASVVAAIRARERAGAAVPAHTATAIEALGLRVVESDGERRVVAGAGDGDPTDRP